MKVDVISDLHRRLDEKEPWSDDELESYSNQDRAFIRNLQLKDKSNKTQAKKKFIRYAQKSKTAFKKLGRDTRKFIKEHYPKHDVFKTTKKEFKRPQVKESKKQKKQISNVQAVNEYIKSGKKDKTYSRITKTAKKYPDASLYELRHGINSKASKEYRRKHRND